MPKLITGCNGFIGKKFAEKHKSFIGVEDYNAWAMLENFHGWEDIDEIIHMGAISSTTCTDEERLNCFNVEFSIRLFEIAIKHGIPVKYASSASVYGNKHDGSMDPLNLYAKSKVAVDLWVSENIDRFELIQGFRFFNVYGLGEEHKGNQRSPVSKFAEQAVEKGVIEIFEGSEKMFRDFIWVDDIVDIVDNNGEESGIYDLGSGRCYSFRQVAEIIAKKFGAEIKEIPFPEHLKDKYQYNTVANFKWENKEFISIETYISHLSLLDMNQSQSVS